MGRHSDEGVLWTYGWDGTNHIIFWYCSIHKTFDRVQNANFNTAFGTLETHLSSTDHATMVDL